jgi:hypothetical protein
MSDQDWACEAYGEDMPGPRHCFFELGERCASAGECVTRLPSERQRVFDRIQELAESGDPVSVFLAAEIERPEDLLGGNSDDSSRP